MDEETFEAFLDQLRRYIRERLIPAEADVIDSDRVPDAILAEMRDMGLFALTTPEAFGGADLNISQYIRVIREMGWPAPAFRATMSINTGMFSTAL
ncbi:MAG: acyl-CoA dehydrogenase family protein, partial [Pseudomonadota bacterium]|nr:acyl-CoA dehydrogenase family protein [Pseudomonadota bacterium]